MAWVGPARRSPAVLAQASWAGQPAASAQPARATLAAPAQAPWAGLPAAWVARVQTPVVEPAPVVPLHRRKS